MCLKDIITFAPEGQDNKLKEICRKSTLTWTLLFLLARKSKMIKKLAFLSPTYILRMHK